jgi:hypothetical protein
MGWGSGSGLMSSIIDAIQEEEIDDTVRQTIYQILIESFEDYDCDTLDECVGTDPAFDKAYYQIHPQEDNDDDDDCYFEQEYNDDGC